MKHQAVWLPLGITFLVLGVIHGHPAYYGLAAAFLVVSAGIATKARQQNKPR